MNRDEAIALLEEWLADESGYDEEVWPQVEAAIAEHLQSVTEPAKPRP